MFSSFRDLDTPKVGDGEVLVRVQAAGVNPGDCLELRGIPYAARLMGYGLTETEAPGARHRCGRPCRSSRREGDPIPARR